MIDNPDYKGPWKPKMVRLCEFMVLHVSWATKHKHLDSCGLSHLGIL
jgi:hypothetical protein